MKNFVTITKKINNYKKQIHIPSDKSLSIRWALLAAQAIGRSKAYNLLDSEDVNSCLNAIKKLGIKVIKKKKITEIISNGLNSFSFKKNTIINANNSGTTARLICGMLVKSKKSIILKGDKSLSKRDFSRIIKPLNLFGVNIESKKGKLPLIINGTDFLRPIYKYKELIGSAQVKSCIMLAALNTPLNSITQIYARPSRDHTERLFKYLKIPIKIKKQKNFELIEIKGGHQYKSFTTKISGDISSSSFLILLTLLSKNSEIIIKNVNINKTRTGIIDLLKMMNAKITIINKKKNSGEEIGDIYVKSTKKLRAIRPNSSINSRAIDELPLIFLACAKAKGISFFKNLGELRHKEQDRLKFSVKFLKMCGIKVIQNLDCLKIYGEPNLNLQGNYVVKNFMKDHRAFMMSCVAALTLGGKWKIYDQDSIKTSFPNYIKLLKFLGAKIK